MLKSSGLLARHFLIVAVLLAAAVVAARAEQDALGAAKDLYASAAYEDALAALTRMDATPDSAREVDEYRAFCLYALGRTSEAETVAEALIRRDPLVEIDSRDASPRIEAMFTDVRKRLLPGLIRSEYRAGRELFDQKKTAEAQPHLASAAQMLARAQKLGAWDDSLADLRVLVDGFLELTRADAAASAKASPAAAPPAPAAASPTSAATPDKALSKAPAGKTFDAADENLTPPVAIYQVFPPVPPSLMPIVSSATKGGVLDVVIDETGSVQDVTMRQSVNPMYDTLLLGAARRWKYRPALKNGVPVKFVKTIIVSVEPKEE